MRKDKIVATDASQQNRVVIDVGLHAIKFAYFKDRRLCLEEIPIFEKPKNILGLKQRELMASQRAVIRRAVNRINPQAEFILSPQPSPLVLTKIIHRPPDTDVRGYLTKVLPFEPDQFSFDVQEVGFLSEDKKFSKSKQKSSRLAATAADLDSIKSSIGLLGEFQRQIKRLTPKGVALLNYLLLTANDHEDHPVIFLDLGALYSHLIVYKGKGQFLVRTIELGGHHINRELVENLNVDFETAEKIKTERELIDESLFDNQGNSTSISLFQAVNRVLFGLVDEIKKTMTYFEDYFVEDLSNGFILLAGGTSKLKHLDRFLMKELQLPVKRVENAVYDRNSENQFLPQFASTIGLLGTANERGLLNLNLLNHIEGLLFKLKDGDYYLTRDGFVNKKRYKRFHKTKALVPSLPKKTPTAPGEQALLPARFIKNIPGRIGALFNGENIEASRFRFPLTRQIDLNLLKNGWKHIFVFLGVLFLIVYGGNEFHWASKKKNLDWAINMYLDKSKELDHARGAFIGGMGKAGMGGIRPEAKLTRADKIIWASKLKTLATAVPERIWISNLVIKGSPPSLNLFCHVYSNGKDHLKDIALFIKDLKSQKVFFQDFKEVKFHSARRSKKNKDIYDFTLLFLLNREMIEEKKETVAKAKVS